MRMSPLLIAAAAALALPAAAHAEPAFIGPTNVPVGDQPRSIAVSDFNRDADPDLAIANLASGNVSLLHGGAGGTMSAAGNQATGNQPMAVATGDFNADADADLAVTHVTPHNVAVLLGKAADDGFAPDASYPAASTPASVAVADFNADGDPDLAVPNGGHGTVSVRAGGAGGSFGAATDLAVRNGPYAVATGDFDGDGDPDLAVANILSDEVSILLGATGASFAAATTHGAGDGPLSIAVADFNGDGDPDLAVANENSDDVSVLIGGAGGGFAAAPSVGAGDGPRSVAAGDLDGDSHVDLVVANQHADDVSVLLGDGEGGFTAGGRVPAGDGPSAVAVADLNGDGGPDLAVANQRADTVSILINDLPPEADADAYATDEDETLVVDAPGVLGNDADPEGAALTAEVVAGPGHGALELEPDGSLTYVPEPDFSGVDTFRYLAGDGSVDSEPATVTIDVRPAPDAPTASADAYATDEDTPLSVAAPGVLGNDHDPDGDGLTAELVSGPGHGDLELAPDGSLTYTPDPDRNGSDTFTYRATDGTGESEVVVTIDVRPVDETAPGGSTQSPSSTVPPAGEPPPAAAATRLGLRVDKRCVRSGRVRVRVIVRLSRPGRVRLRLHRAARRSRGCARPPKTARWRPTRVRRAVTLQATARLTLRLRLRPGLYRLTARAHGARPVHRYLRVRG